MFTSRQPVKNHREVSALVHTRITSSRRTMHDIYSKCMARALNLSSHLIYFRSILQNGNRPGLFSIRMPRAGFAFFLPFL